MSYVPSACCTPVESSTYRLRHCEPGRTSHDGEADAEGHPIADLAPCPSCRVRRRPQPKGVGSASKYHCFRQPHVIGMTARTVSDSSRSMSGCAVLGSITIITTLTTMTESTAQQPRPETHGSRTLTVNTNSDTPEASAAESASDSREGTPSSVGVLRLRGGPIRRNHVAWSAETVDNEGMGKKKSKSEGG